MSAERNTGGDTNGRLPEMDNPKPTSDLLRDEKSSVDYMIQVEGRSFPVHKDVMVALSDYFQTMLIGSTQMSESQKDVVVIEGVSAAVMELLLDFVYKNRLDVTTENVTEVLAGAMYLQMKPAIKVCTDFMVRNLDTDNWYDVFSLFRMYNLMDGIEQIKAYIRQDMQEVLKTLDFSQVQYEGFSCIVYMWRTSEWALLEIIQRWVGVDYDKRKEHLDDLLSHVRYGLMTPMELRAVSETKEMHHSLIARQLVDNAHAYHRLPVHQKVLDTSEQTKVRSDLTFVNCVVARASYLHNSNGDIHVISKNELKFPGRFCSYRHVEVNNFIVVGGAPLGIAVWYILNPRTSEWTQIEQLPRRFLETVVVSDGRHIYALGGHEFDEYSEVMRDIDRFDFRTGTWSYFNMLPTKMVAFGACVLGNGLYISGGQSLIKRFTQDPPPFARMDRLDLTSGKWESKPQLLKPRSKHTMSVMKILGEEVCCIVDSELNVEYYSPLREQWSRCTFTFSKPLPVRNTENMLLKGNTVFLYDICVSEEEEDSEYMCMQLNIPEDGTEVAVEFIYKHKSGLNWGSWFALSLPPESNDRCDTGQRFDSGEKSDTGETYQKKKRRRRRKKGKYF